MNIGRKLHAWVMSTGVPGRTLSHVVVGVLVTLLWWGVSALTGASIWYGCALVVGHYLLREVEDVVVKGQDATVGWLEVTWPGIASAVLCALLA